MGVGAAGHEARGDRVRLDGHEEALAVGVGDGDAGIDLVHDVVVERDAEGGEHLVEARRSVPRVVRSRPTGRSRRRRVPPWRSQLRSRFASSLENGCARTGEHGDGAAIERIVRAGRGRVDARELVVVLLEQVAHAPERVALVLLRVERQLAVAHGEAELRPLAAEHAADRLRQGALLARLDVHVVGGSKRSSRVRNQCLSPLATITTASVATRPSSARPASRPKRC